VRKLVKSIVRYVCEVCGAVFDDEEEAKECEEQKVQPFKFELKEKVIIKGRLLPEKVETVGRYRTQKGHQNIYEVGKTIGWEEEPEGEQKFVVPEKDLLSLEEYEKKMANLFNM
jgi:hypothetical protein